MTKNLMMLVSGGMLLALSACGDKDIPGNCQPTLADDPDCLVDGVCEAECALTAAGCDAAFEAIGVDDEDLLDRNDPDCDPCLYDDSCDTCDYEANADTEECICEGANPPAFCDPNVPGTANMSAVFAYDAATDTGRSYFLESDQGDVEVQPFFTVLVEGERFDATNNPAFLCSMQVEATGTLTAAPFSAEIRTQANLQGGEDTRVYEGMGVTFTQGNFTVADFPRDTQGGRIPGCSEWYIDPAVWGNESTGIADALNAADWQFAWTNMAPVITELITQDQANDPNDAYDIYDLYGDGENFVVGGTMSKIGTQAQTAYYVSLGLDVDGDWKLVDSGNADDPNSRIPWDEMLPEEGKPKTGVYEVRSYNQWNAQFIFLDVSPGG